MELAGRPRACAAVSSATARARAPTIQREVGRSTTGRRERESGALPAGRTDVESTGFPARRPAAARTRMSAESAGRSAPGATPWPGERIMEPLPSDPTGSTPMVGTTMAGSTATGAVTTRLPGAGATRTGAAGAMGVGPGHGSWAWAWVWATACHRGATAHRSTAWDTCRTPIPTTMTITVQARHGNGLAV